MKEKMIVFVISVIVLIGLAAGLLIDESRVDSTIEAERKANYAFLGKSAALSEARAERWYQTLFVKTQVTQFTFDIAGGAAPNDTKADDSKLEATAHKGVEWWKSRMRVLWSIAFQFLVRLSNIVVWAPLCLLVFLPFVVDAMAVRKIKSTNFSLASPHLQLFGTRAMVWIAVIYLLLQLLPIMVHPVTAPVAMGLFSLATWIGITQFAKRA